MTPFSTGSPPERAFRIADRRHTVFDGRGAFLKGARWNSPGRLVVYASLTFEGALLEKLVHTGRGIPKHQSWIQIEFPRGLSVEEVTPEQLPDWSLPGSIAARQYGDAWHESNQTLILIVPSLPAGGIGRNVLINQSHPEFGRLTASVPRPVVWDGRLFGR